MIIGVMSDTHGHLTEMRKAASRMVDEFGATVLIHLGDDSTDADELRGVTQEFFSVPGIFEARYKDANVPNRMIREFMDIPFLLTHTPTANPHDRPNDIDPTAAAQDKEVKVVLHGHTHKPHISERFGAYYVNPGHLNPKDDRGSEMTFGIIELDPPKMQIKIIALEGGTVEQKLFFVE